MAKTILPIESFLIVPSDFKKSYDKNNIFSLLEAFEFYCDYVEDSAHPVPKWMKIAIVDTIVYRLLNGKVLEPTGGPSSTETTLAINRLNKFFRWLAVKRFIAEGKKVTEAIEAAKAYWCENITNISKDTIQKNYYEVEKAIKNSQMEGIFIRPKSSTLEKIKFFEKVCN